MQMTRNFLMALAAVTAVAAATAATPVLVQPKVAVLLHFDSSNDRDKLLGLVKKAMAVDAKLGCSCTTRVWGGGFGGDGGVTIVTEYASLVAMAQYSARRDASTDWAQFITEAMASGIKPGVSSVIDDVTP
jgi:hypothetical protein